ncbi:MAG TPA: hypothetical protein VHO06_04795 [Polyangia bacterium]|nr:hypothetical protein [Polyangia bacterium]
MSAGSPGGAAPEPWRRALPVSLPALAFLLGCTPLADFDVWWHLRAGQLILERGAVPRLDLFTYTDATRPHGAPAHKPFMDPRLEVNTQETFERYLAHPAPVEERSRLGGGAGDRL